ncbi:hypothetical protein R6Q59_001826 [Mikania micrantha]
MKIWFLFVLLCVGLNVVNGRCSVFVDGYQVNIKSDIINEDVILHCKSKDDDLGSHVLRSPNVEYQWSFCQSFGGSTLFYCHFVWKNFERTFDVFNKKLAIWCFEERREGNRCNWEIRVDGFYFQYNHTTWLKEHLWIPKTYLMLA